jgi:hypothetical protein
MTLTVLGARGRRAARGRMRIPRCASGRRNPQAGGEAGVVRPAGAPAAPSDEGTMQSMPLAGESAGRGAAVRAA